MIILTFALHFGGFFGNLDLQKTSNLSRTPTRAKTFNKLTKNLWKPSQHLSKAAKHLFKGLSTFIALHLRNKCQFAQGLGVISWLARRGGASVVYTSERGEDT